MGMVIFTATESLSPILFPYQVKAHQRAHLTDTGHREETLVNINLLYDWILKLLGTSPLPDARQAVGVIAVGKDPKPPLGGRRFLIHHFHADTAHFVLTCLKGKGLLHVVLKCRHAHLSRERCHRLLQSMYQPVPCKTKVSMKGTYYRKNKIHWLRASCLPFIVII